MAGVRLGEELEGRLSKLADRMKRSKSVLIRQAVEEKIEDWEDMAAAMEALENPGRIWTLEELENEADLRPDAVDR